MKRFGRKERDALFHRRDKRLKTGEKVVNDFADVYGNDTGEQCNLPPPEHIVNDRLSNAKNNPKENENNQPMTESNKVDNGEILRGEEDARTVDICPSKDYQLKTCQELDEGEEADPRDAPEGETGDGEVSNNNTNGRNGNYVNISPDLVLASLLTCGSQRMSTTMYTVVRKLFSSKQCSVCGTSLSGTALPGLTYLKGTVKPTIKHWYAKHDIVNVVVDQSKAGAKTGIDGHRSDRTAPMTVVKPSEWARRDFYTPCIRRLIWEDVDDSSNVFGSIEGSPIVRNRSICMSEIVMSSKEGLEKRVKKGSKVEIKLVADESITRVLKKVKFEDMKMSNKGGVRTIILTASVTKTEYVSNDRKGHKVVKGGCFQDHREGVQLAGDVNVYLLCDGGNCCLVNRHNCDIGDPPVFLSICVDNDDGSCKHRKITVDECTCNDDDDVQDDYAPRSGYLEDGTKYFVYRFLLYTDGFNAHRSKTGSMDGMYIIPLGIPIAVRTDTGCLHKICLAPPGVSATDIIDLINEDVVNGMTEGVDVDVDGVKCKIFLDLVCYIGDSPALASATGCKGHRSDSHCHVCTVQRKKIGNLQIASSKTATSSNCSHRRTFQKVVDIRSQQLGIVDTDKLGVGNMDAPLLRLTKKIRNVNHVPRTSDGCDVVPRSFDCFRSSLISPDHVFLGLIGNVTEVLLRLLKPKQREDFDRYCVDMLRNNGLYGRKSVLNADQKLLKATISESFSILFVCPMVLKCMGIWDEAMKHKAESPANTTIGDQSKSVEKKTKSGKAECDKEISSERRMKALQTTMKLIEKLRDIVVCAQTNPNMNIDAKSDLDKFNEEKGRKRLASLVQESKVYAGLIERLSKDHHPSAKELDKPNIHRFMELFSHTLPLFGSIKFIEELILEKAHQSAKRAIDKSNMKNEQVQAMNDYLHDDLVSRLKSITRGCEEGKVVKSDRLAKELGEFLGYVGSKDNCVCDAFSPDVLATIGILGADMCNRNEPVVWSIEKTAIRCSPEDQSVMDRCYRKMDASLKEVSTRERWDNVHCQYGNSAVLKKPKGEMDSFQRVSKIMPSDIVEVCCTPVPKGEDVVCRRSDVLGERLFVHVIGFLHTVQNSRDIGYCVGHVMCEEKNKEEGPEEKEEKDGVDNKKQWTDIDMGTRKMG